jgi:TPR repeat protein
MLALDHRACALGSAGSCLSAALQGLFDIRFAEVRVRERGNARRGCELGEPTCCEIAELFAAYDRGADEATHARATQLGVTRCEGGDAGACRFAAARFAKTANGKYGPTDPARAAELSARAAQLTHEACTRGDVSSCESELHAHAEGPARDRARALFREQLEPLCGQGMLYACFRMAWHFYNTKFGEELQPRALQWFGAACDAGIAEACFLEGSMLSRGRGVPRDPAAAAVRHARACAMGHPNACASLEPD